MNDKPHIPPTDGQGDTSLRRFDLHDPDDPLECMLFLRMERDRKRSRRVRVATDPCETEREIE